MNPVRRVLARTVLRQASKTNIRSPNDILRPCIATFWGNSVEWTDALRDELHCHLFPEAMTQDKPIQQILRRAIRNDTASEDDLFNILRSLQMQHVLPTVRSVTLTRGLEVDLVTGCVDASADRFVFAYNILLRNVGDRPIRVICRNYEFRDDTGRLVSHIAPGAKESMGIVGYTPLIEPNVAMLFGSGVSFRTPTGTLTGSFTACFDYKRADAVEKGAVADRFPFMKKLVQEKPPSEKFEAILGPVNFDARIVAETFQDL
eukprot:GEMP01036572.1.p1 GENE.GEMP01036572.1~~GEMP01036572.1.p1  ORF type:complete len:261 (+),score=32.85 GEMP01036572.1:38-820(+)